METKQEHYESMMQAIARYAPSADLEVIQRAYAYADEKHKNQLRKSGEPYIIHPLAVAEIVAEIGLDTDAIAAALLHDCLEDTDASFEEISRLFGETVRRVNIRDYTLAQAEAWAAGEADLLTRDDWFRRLYTLVAEADGQIAGYGNVDDTGYLDHLFVRWDCQGQGIAAALCDALEAHCRELGVDAVTVHASKTALPFFLGRGYAIEREQQVPCRGQVLTNYALEKIL